MSIKDYERRKLKLKRLHSKTMDIVNSNIINSANVNVFERLIRPTSQLELMYRLSDYDRDGSPSQCYTKFKYNFNHGMNYNLVILCKTTEGNVFGLYTPKCSGYVERNDELKPFIFSVDEDIIIGNRFESSGNYVVGDFDEEQTGLLIDIEGYQWDLFADGHAYGRIITTIDNARKYHNIGYTMFTSYIAKDDNQLQFFLNYAEMEIYQIIDDIGYIEPNIIAEDNIDILKQLTFPIDQLELIQAFKSDEYYLNGKYNIGELHNIVVIVKSMSGKVFGICRKGYDISFYSVDLNEKYELFSSPKLTIGIKSIELKSGELCLKLALNKEKPSFGLYHNRSYIGFNDKNNLRNINIEEIIGDVKHDSTEFWHNNNYTHTYEFRWLEVDVYAIPPLRPTLITFDNANIIENLTIPFNKLRLAAVFTNDDYYITPGIKLKRNPNVLILIKTTTNFTFAIYKRNDKEAYFCSIDLNERYPLVNCMIFISLSYQTIKIKSDELYIDIVEDPVGCIQLKINNLFDDHELSEVIGRRSRRGIDRAYTLEDYDDSDEDSEEASAVYNNDIYGMSASTYYGLFHPTRFNYTGFDWMEFDIYEIKE